MASEVLVVTVWLYLPWPQSVHELAADVDHLPYVQVPQLVDDVSPIEFEYLPAAQGLHVDSSPGLEFNS